MLKDPNAVLPFGVDWSPWLSHEGDTIASSSWVVIPASAVTIETQAHDTTTTTVWLSGGTHGQTIKARNRIVTAGGRTDDRTLTIDLRDR